MVPTRPLLDHRVKSGRFLQIQRSIYRLRDFPSADQEDLVVAYLWMHYAPIPAADRAWSGPVTTALRTLADCVTDNVQPDLVD